MASAFWRLATDNFLELGIGIRRLGRTRMQVVRVVRVVFTPLAGWQISVFFLVFQLKKLCGLAALREVKEDADADENRQLNSLKNVSD
ncbi:MAG: hypothetical protein IJV05_06415 [Muribaculaceae bacterium]|nr:hypothetical protein [Muribaculaceae bacterium]